MALINGGKGVVNLLFLNKINCGRKSLKSFMKINII